MSNKKNKSFNKKYNSNTLIFILIILIIITSIFILFAIKKQYFSYPTINNTTEKNNYEKEDTSLIKTIHISNILETETQYDNFYNNSLFIGGEFLKEYEKYISDNKIYKNISIYAHENLKICDILNNNVIYDEKNIKSFLEDKKKIFIMLGIADLKDKNVSNVINDYIKLINSFDNKIDIFIINEIYYNKSLEDKFIDNSKIREMNYKMDKLKSELNYDFINFSHAIINSSGYLTTEYYEKDEYKEKIFIVFTNLLKIFSFNKIDNELKKDAKKGLDLCEKELTYDICNDAKNKIEKISKGTEKDFYIKKINSILSSLKNKLSTDLEYIYINDEKITVNNNNNFIFNVKHNISIAKIEAKAISSDSLITGLDNYVLSNGNNFVRLTVKNNDKTKVYTLNIIREADFKINKILVNKKEVDLDYLIFEIDKDIKKIELEVFTNDKNAIVKCDVIINISEDDNNIVFSINGFEYTLILQKK